MGQSPQMMGQFPPGGFMSGYPQMGQSNGFDMGRSCSLLFYFLLCRNVQLAAVVR